MSNNDANIYLLTSKHCYHSVLSIYLRYLDFANIHLASSYTWISKHAQPDNVSLQTPTAVPPNPDVELNRPFIQALAYMKSSYTYRSTETVWLRNILRIHSKLASSKSGIQEPQNQLPGSQALLSHAWNPRGAIKGLLAKTIAPGSLFTAYSQMRG